MPALLSLWRSDRDAEAWSGWVCAGESRCGGDPVLTRSSPPPLVFRFWPVTSVSCLPARSHSSELLSFPCRHDKAGGASGGGSPWGDVASGPYASWTPPVWPERSSCARSSSTKVSWSPTPICVIYRNRLTGPFCTCRFVDGNFDLLMPRKDLLVNCQETKHLQKLGHWNTSTNK